MSDTKH